MNREIKFKVFHKGSITERIKIDGYERINGNRWEWMSLELNPDKGERWSRGVYSWSDKYIRTQFTGLKDEEGKEIYEGDIIKLNSEFWIGGIGSIEWDDSYSMWRTNIKDKGYMACGYLTLGIALRHHVKIIGNIFENPELIKKESIA